MSEGYGSLGIGVGIVGVSIWALRMAYLEGRIFLWDSGGTVAKDKYPWLFWPCVAMWSGLLVFGLYLMFSGSIAVSEIPKAD